MNRDDLPLPGGSYDYASHLLADAARFPNLRVLDDGYGSIAYAAFVPKGNEDRLAYVNEFIKEAIASGLVKQAIERANLRGVQIAPAGSPKTQ